MGNWNSGGDYDEDDFADEGGFTEGFGDGGAGDQATESATESATSGGRDENDDDNYYSSDTYSGTFDTDTSVGDDKDDTTTGSLPSFLDYTTSTTTAPDSDGDGIPDTIDTDSRPSVAPDTDSDGIPDYLDADTGPSFTSVYDPFAGSDYGVGTPQTTTYGQPTSFGDLYDPFAGGSYIDTAPPGDSDADGIPDSIDSDFRAPPPSSYANAQEVEKYANLGFNPDIAGARPYDPYQAFQALPSTSFQKELISNPRQALKSFGVEPKKIDTLKDGSQVFTVKVNQKNPISGEVQERSFVYTTGPQGAKVNDLYDVTDENKLGDALGNALGFAAPLAMGLPGRLKVDTKEMMKYATEPSPFKEYDVSKQYYSTSAVSALEKDLFRTTTIETEAERTARLAAEQAERESDRGDDSGRMTAAEKIVQEATDPEETKDYEYYLRQFGTTTPMSYSPYDVMRGRVPYSTQTAAVGGQIEQNDYLTVNAEYVKQMPDAFMRDPATAKSADEVRAIFAHNRRVKEIAGGVQTMSDGGQAVEPGNVAVVGESGPIVANPEEVTEAESVADNVEKTVPEGTFIINQPAAELMGTSDVKDMLLNAVKELRKQGVDFSFGEGKIAEEDAVSLLVSKGEIMVHPLLAKVIGIGRLNKINNRGKAEVEKRIAENGQSPEAEQAQSVAAEGGIQLSEVGSFLADMTPVVGEIKSGAEAYEAYQKGDMPGMIMGALGAIPIAGKFLKPAGKVAKALADFKPDAMLYHATDKTFGKLATQQDVGVHLGSLKVADERAKNISKPRDVDDGFMTKDGTPLDEVPEYKEGISIRPYAVKFGKVFKTDDALAWDQASAAADTILKSKDGSKLSPNAKKQIQKVRVETESLDSAVDAGVDFDVLNIEGLKKINETLRKEGYDTIQYKNRGEVPGEADYERATFRTMPEELRTKSMEDSYIFLDPDKSLRSSLTGKMADGGKVSQGFISRPL